MSATGAQDRERREDDFIVIKGQPDRAKYNAEQEELKKEIDALEKRLQGIVIEKSGSGGPEQEKRDALRKELDEIKAENRKAKSERERILEQVKAQQDVVTKKVSALQAAKKELPFKNSGELDARVRDLEDEINTGRLPLVEEKRLLNRITQLKRQRTLVDGFAAQQKDIDAAKKKVDDLRKQMDSTRRPAGAQNGSGPSRYQEIIAELDALNAKWAKTRESRDKAFEQRNAVRTQLNAAYDKKRASAKAFRDAKDAYQKKLQAAIEERNEKRRAAKAEVDAQKRDARHAEWREQAAVPAHNKDIDDLNTVSTELRKRAGLKVDTPAPAPAPEPAQPASSSSLPPPPEGREADAPSPAQGFVLLEKKRPDNGPVHAHKPKKASSTPARLRLDLGVIQVLLKHNITVPPTTSDIGNTLGLIDARIAHLKETQDAATAANIQAVEEKIKRELAN